MEGYSVHRLGFLCLDQKLQNGISENKLGHPLIIILPPKILKIEDLAPETCLTLTFAPLLAKEVPESKRATIVRNSLMNHTEPRKVFKKNAKINDKCILSF